MEYDNTNSGALFKNRDKETDKHPDYTGKINVDGKELRLAAWLAESKSGQKFMRLKVSELSEKKQDRAMEKIEALDDDIPF